MDFITIYNTHGNKFMYIQLGLKQLLSINNKHSK